MVLPKKKEKVDPVTLFLMAIDSIFAHKLRSFLVTLGILIGITAVLVNAAMVSGFQAYFEKQMQELGSNFVNITPGSGTAAMMGIYDEETYLSQNTFESVRRLPYVKDASADRVAFGSVSYMGEDEEVAVIGVEPGFFVARDQNLALGNPFTAQDRYTVIVDESVLSGSTSRPLALMSRVEITVTTPEGRRVTEEFRVKGLAEQMQAGFGISY
ncbi:MAG: ABC transporter permease, partial [Chloroflexota bacterium]|nr:ABC transporter permease [Chloroflexota bacterium]